MRPAVVRGPEFPWEMVGMPRLCGAWKVIGVGIEEGAVRLFTTWVGEGTVSPDREMEDERG